MSKSVSKKKVVVTAKKATPTATRPKVSSTPSGPLVFSRRNYILMVGGILLIALGLLLMSGGAMPSPDVWDESIIYSFRRTVLAPLVIVLGLILEIVAIFFPSKKESVTESPAE